MLTARRGRWEEGGCLEVLEVRAVEAEHEGEGRGALRDYHEGRACNHFTFQKRGESGEIDTS